MSNHLDESDDQVKAEMDECKTVLRQIIGQIDDHFVEYLMLKEDLSAFEANVFVMGEDLEVLRSVASPSERVKQSIREKAEALALHNKQYVPAAEAAVQASTAKFALYLRAVQRLNPRYRAENPPGKMRV